MVKIRLARHGVKKRPFYKIVVTNSRNARNGKFIESIGYFNPIEKNFRKSIYINFERITFWENNGAKFSDRVKSLIKKVKIFLKN